MIKRILFLDIDGVLNSENSAIRYRGFWRLAPENIEALNMILDQARPKIVISSTWRLNRSLLDLELILLNAGANVRGGQIIGATPRLGKHRGFEIDQWLKENGHQSSSFVILDDDADMEMHMAKLVQTDGKYGLTSRDALKVLEMFGVLQRVEFQFNGRDGI